MDTVSIQCNIYQNIHANLTVLVNKYFFVYRLNTFGLRDVSVTSGAAIEPIFNQTISTDGSGLLYSKNWPLQLKETKTTGQNTEVSVNLNLTIVKHNKVEPKKIASLFSIISTMTVLTGTMLLVIMSNHGFVKKMKIY